MIFRRGGPSYLTVSRPSSRATTSARSARAPWSCSRWSARSGAFLWVLRGISQACWLTRFRELRFRQKSDILTAVIEQTFGTLVTLATNLLNSPPAGAEQEIPAILHIILKTYKHSIVLNLSSHQQNPTSLVPWGRLLFDVVNLRIPHDAVPAHEEERERSEWWKAKKWACGILGRLFHR